jgi:hypothetical protein
MDVAPGIMSRDASESHFLPFYVDEMIRLFSRFEGSSFYAAILAVHLSATIPHGTNSMGDS